MKTEQNQTLRGRIQSYTRGHLYARTDTPTGMEEDCNSKGGKITIPQTFPTTIIGGVRACLLGEGEGMIDGRTIRYKKTCFMQDLFSDEENPLSIVERSPPSLPFGG